MMFATMLTATLAVIRIGSMSSQLVAELTSIFTSAALLGQTGTTKTAIGWGMVALCIGLGLLVIGRPNVRNPMEKKKSAKKKK